GIVWHDPFGDEEVTLRLLLCLTIAHRDVDRLAGVREVHHELSGAIAFPGGRVDRSHAETDGLAAFVLIAHRAVAGLAGTEEVHQVAGENQPLVSGLILAREGRGCAERQRHEARGTSHGSKELFHDVYPTRVE